jgi:hypothetical protein
MMPFIVILIGAIIAIAAFNDSHRTLALQLQQDIPGYFKWAAAIAAILGLGFVPGLKIPSRYLLGLVALVVVLTNYKQIFAGFTQFADAANVPTGTGAADPTSAYVQSGGTGGLPTQAQISGIATPGSTATAAAANPLNPNSYVGLAAGFGGLA